MPRVNRDLQRRMAARRERERRRPPPDRRYRFASPESPEDEAQEGLVDGQDLTTAEDATSPSDVVEQRPKRSRPARTARVADSTAAPSTRGGARPAHKPFSEYKAEYAYVFSDLRRVGLVVGSLLLILILLYFVLPH